MDNKGQALIEFVLILPVFLMILFAIVDFGTIISDKSALENDSASIIEIYKNGSSVDEIRDLYSDLDIDIAPYKDKYLKVEVTKKVNLITPGLGRIMGNPYLVIVKRVINAT